LREEIENLADQTPIEESVVLDFAGVDLISYSFADELVSGLLSDRLAGRLGERAVVVTGANEDVLEPIQRSLERRDYVGAYLQSDRVVLLHAPPHLQETFDACQERGEFRTGELAQDLAISVSACNNRLKPLLASGLLARVEATQPSGGREFVYSVSRLPIDTCNKFGTSASVPAVTASAW
jgi:hypothetical protein